LAKVIPATAQPAAGAAADSEADASSRASRETVDRRRVARWRLNQLGLALTILLLLAVVALIPVALLSLRDELFMQEEGVVFDMPTGTQVDPAHVVHPETTFVNITVTNLDEARRVASLTVSGHRVCGEICPPVNASFFSLGNDAARRQGLPPSATVTVPGVSGPFTFEVELPIYGRPQLYPFDSYTLLLGSTVAITGPAGRELRVPAAEMERQGVSFTIEDRVARMNMSPPVPIDPETVRSPNDPDSFALVDRLVWERPLYLRIVSVLLVLLITASSVFALGLHSLHELLLGIGGIILGIWGVRSVVVQSQLPDVTLIDLMLSVIIMLLLAALAVRVARHFYVQSKVRPSGGVDSPRTP
jgi:hypothetical protein